MLVASPLVKSLCGSRFRARRFYPRCRGNNAQVRIRYGFYYQVARVLSAEFNGLLVLLRGTQIFTRRPIDQIHGCRCTDIRITERTDDIGNTREVKSESR